MAVYYVDNYVVLGHFKIANVMILIQRLFATSNIAKLSIPIFNPIRYNTTCTCLHTWNTKVKVTFKNTKMLIKGRQ